MYIYVCMYIHIYTIWTCLRSSELVKTKIFWTSFVCGYFERNLLKF